MLLRVVLIPGVADFGTVNFGPKPGSKNLFALSLENFEFDGSDSVAAVEKVVRVENSAQNKFAVFGTD